MSLSIFSKHVGAPSRTASLFIDVWETLPGIEPLSLMPPLRFRRFIRVVPIQRPSQRWRRKKPPHGYSIELGRGKQVSKCRNGVSCGERSGNTHPDTPRDPRVFLNGVSPSPESLLGRDLGSSIGVHPGGTERSGRERGGHRTKRRNLMLLPPEDTIQFFKQACSI